MTVLDPACGSGNFLYVSLQLLKDLEKEVIHHPLWHDLPVGCKNVSEEEMTPRLIFSPVQVLPGRMVLVVPTNLFYSHNRSMRY